MSNGPMLTGAVAKIAIQSAGGWKIAIDVPESMEEAVRQLLGHENRTIYNIGFNEVGEIEQGSKRGPGRPAKSEGAE